MMPCWTAHVTLARACVRDFHPGPAHMQFNRCAQVGPVSGALRGRSMDAWTPKQVADTVLIDRRARRRARASCNPHVHMPWPGSAGLRILQSALATSSPAPHVLHAAPLALSIKRLQQSLPFADVCKAEGHACMMSVLSDRSHGSPWCLARSTARVSSGQRVSLHQVESAVAETRDGQPYFVYEHIAQVGWRLCSAPPAWR